MGTETANDHDAAGFSFEPGSHDDVWLAKYRGRPIGAVGYALGDGRWRAAWRGALVGDSYDSREDAARALLDRLEREADA
ncbi:MAG TPA: hypothetical protein VH916_05380 [Dehalococcoidia bacterium]|jgi:hypothetical protein